MRRGWKLPLAGAALVASLSLAGCAAPAKPVGPAPAAIDPLWTQQMKAARSAFERGRLESAQRLYQRALDRARSLDQPGNIADAAYNLAACRVALGQAEQARPLLGEARAELERSAGDPADVLLLEARVALLLNHPQEATQLARQLLARHPPAAAELRLLAHLLLGTLASERGEPAQAEVELARAAALEAQTGDPALRAGLCELAGRLCLLRGEFARAAAHFDAQAGLLREARQPQAMVGALLEAAGAHQRAGALDLAAERLYRAARARLGQGNPQAARPLAERALGLASSGGEPQLAAAIRALLAELPPGGTGGESPRGEAF
ncbi:hypothetical protein DESUT3_09110 [Desulfuromonas versatilis]|uniref:Tetratricopeptide repeat protein n=1 Tax=Desulfuromonas versatilis TaxID=2802975 RepID=A0ABN6DUP5_9BACT|nr:hypothetical protein [Desulfuromonas versatilis]BCR03842.1 hypothetical protein DESUT3_09110 [Desulfuromonas versatilis]